MDQPDAQEHRLGPDTNPTRARSFVPHSELPVQVPPVHTSPEKLPADGALPFGALLGPVLVKLCDGQLSKLNWFRTDWQRGGALTGYAMWRDENGIDRPAVVKLPVPPVEHRWLVQLSSDEITPRVFAHGSELGGYDMAWVIMERLPHGPIGREWGNQALELLAAAAARFYASARLMPIGQAPGPRDWKAQLKRAKDHISPETIDDSQRWRQVLKAVGKMLPSWLKTWQARDTGYWCHGDLHLGNAMSRLPPPDGPAVLFDLAAVHRGHWVEDAIYLEHLYWARPQQLRDINLCKLIAHYLRDEGLHPGENWHELANIYRALLAMVTPAHLNTQGGRAQAAAALVVLEGLV